jgi:quinol monooxygenase YgiN
MNVYSIWESRFAPETVDEGVTVTKAIWHDMLSCDGYVTHEVIQDAAQPGHLIVVSQWVSRAAADAAMSYASHPNAQRADKLASEPRRRTVGAAI